MSVQSLDRDGIRSRWSRSSMKLVSTWNTVAVLLNFAKRCSFCNYVPIWETQRRKNITPLVESSCWKQNSKNLLGLGISFLFAFHPTMPLGNFVKKFWSNPLKPETSTNSHYKIIIMPHFKWGYFIDKTTLSFGWLKIRNFLSTFVNHLIRMF